VLCKVRGADLAARSDTSQIEPGPEAPLSLHST
jgi:hypothetical protein